MELLCPHCKSTFPVDRNDYAAIAAQVRNSEFDDEVKRRLAEIETTREAQDKARLLQAEKISQQRLAEKDAEKAELEKLIATLQATIKNHQAERRAELADAETDKAKALADLRAELEKEVNRLQTELAQASKQSELEVERTKNASIRTLHDKDTTISELNAKLQAQSAASENRIHQLNEQHALLLRAKDEEIAHYKDLKIRLSTKLLGESLEVHCQTLFNRARSQGQFPNAYFEKDNDTSVSGTKGDFIFRDYLNGTEYISIMFEMKNEDERSVSKHRNEDFFAKLDKDRRNKNCEYAILVSTLEADSELYNEGIVDVSYRYDKMLVVRPQFFMSVIALLSRTAHRGAQQYIKLQSELEAAKAQSIDVTNFEARRDKFVQEFGKYVANHLEKQDKAIQALDKAIAQAEKQAEDLRKIKQIFEGAGKKLLKANECAENDFTIKKLTRGNPTMKAKFEEARSELNGPSAKK